MRAFEQTVMLTMTTNGCNIHNKKQIYVASHHSWYITPENPPSALSALFHHCFSSTCGLSWFWGPATIGAGGACVIISYSIQLVNLVTIRWPFL